MFTIRNLGGVALLLAGSGGWLLAHRALAPVAQMTHAAQRISAAHLNERLDESGTGDELDQLAHTLNAMLGRLDDAFRAWSGIGPEQTVEARLRTRADVRLQPSSSNCWTLAP